MKTLLILALLVTIPTAHATRGGLLQSGPFTGCHTSNIEGNFHCHSGQYEGREWDSIEAAHAWLTGSPDEPPAAPDCPAGEVLQCVAVEEPEPPVPDPDPPTEPPGDIVGDWRLNITLGDMSTTGRLELSDRAALSGDFGTYDVPAVVSGDNTAFTLDDPDVGQVAFDLTASGDSLQGTVRAQGQTGQVSGERWTEPEPDPPVEPEPDPPTEPEPEPPPPDPDPPVNGEQVTNGTILYDKVETVYYNGQWRDPYAGLSNGATVPEGVVWKDNRDSQTKISRSGDGAHYKATFDSNRNIHLDVPVHFPNPSTGDVRTLYMSWYVRMSFAPDCGSHKFIRVRDDDSGRQHFGLSLTCMHMSWKRAVGSNQAASHFEDLIPPRNQWSRIELWIDGNRGTAKVWHDGRVVHDVSGIGSISNTNLGMIPTLVGWNPSGSGSGSFGDTFEWDNFYASQTLDRNVPVR